MSSSNQKRLGCVAIVLSLIGLLTISACIGSAAELRDIPRERTLIIGLSGRVATTDLWNPFTPGTPMSNGFQQVLIESLFYLNYETGQLMPWLATSYEYNEDCTEVTIKIRPGVEWSDGVPFTSRDVVFTLDMLKENAPKLLFSGDVAQYVASAEALDAETVFIKLNQRSPMFVVDMFGVREYNALPIVPEHIWKDVDPLTFKNFDPEKGWPVFTGPYELVRAAQSEFAYDRRADWWAAKTGFASLPAAERVLFIWPGAEETVAAALIANNLDIFDDMSRGTFELVRTKNPNITSWYDELPYAWTDPCPRYFAVAHEEPWDDPEMRWALNYGLNKDQIINIAYDGTSVKTATLFPNYTALNAHVERNQDLLDEYAVMDYNPAKAAEIFESKGYTQKRDGYWYGPDGKRLQITIASPDWIEVKTILQVVAEQLDQLGIDTVLRPMEGGAWCDLVWRGQAEAWAVWSCGSVMHPYRTFDVYHSRWVMPKGEIQDWKNDVRWCNAEFDAVVDEMKQMQPDDPAIEPLFRQALEIWLEELPVIPLAQARKLLPMNTTYWTNWPTAENNYIQPPYWWMSAIHLIRSVQPTK